MFGLGPIPSGIADIYNDNLSLIENIVSLKIAKCLKFPGESIPDIAQQIRLICLEAITKFDIKRYTPNLLFGYLSKCVDNRLYNIYRGVYLDNNPPCNRCELWNKTIKDCLVGESGCLRIISYRSRLKQKQSIKVPTSYNYLSSDESEEQERSIRPLHQEQDYSNLTGYWELDSSILDLLSKYHNSEELIYYYNQLKNGFSIPNEKKKLVQDKIRQLLKDL